jgi:malonyl-CoA/methylmalonyl-CoA synthetase
MTETLAISSNPYDGRRQPGSVSPALPAVELRISEQPIGSIQVRGANVFAGYYGAAEKTRLSFTLDGFFITGDLGYLDADGYLYIVGRDKDLIISGGFNVYPVEVEEAINALPGIVESAVIGLPHADFGEAVTAIVVASDSAVLTEPTLVEVAIIDRLRSRLSSFKLPKRVVFADEIPRNAMGKVQKQLLRTRYADLYS